MKTSVRSAFSLACLRDRPYTQICGKFPKRSISGFKKTFESEKHFSARFFSSGGGENDSLTTALISRFRGRRTTVRKEKELVGMLQCSGNSRLSKKKAALRYFPSLDNIGNTIFTESHSFIASLVVTWKSKRIRSNNKSSCHTHVRTHTNI